MLTSPVSETAQHADAQSAAEIAVALVGLSSSAFGRYSGGDPNLVRNRGPVDGLQNELEIEGQLQLADHHNRRITVIEADKIAAANFAFDDVARLFEKALHGQVKRSFHISGDFEV